MKEVLENIRKIRLEKKIKTKDIAEKLGFTPPAYANIEAGRVPLTLDRLKQIAEIFGMSAVDIIQYPNVENVSFDSERVHELEKRVHELEKYISLLENSLKDKDKTIYTLELLRDMQGITKQEKREVREESGYTKGQLFDGDFDENEIISFTDNNGNKIEIPKRSFYQASRDFMRRRLKTLKEAKNKGLLTEFLLTRYYEAARYYHDLFSTQPLSEVQEWDFKECFSSIRKLYEDFEKMKHSSNDIADRDMAGTKVNQNDSTKKSQL